MQYFWHLRGLGDLGDPGSSAQALAIRLENLEVLGRQALQGYGICHWPQGSVGHQEPQV